MGDWYANVLFTRPEQLVVCVSERTLLPVVVLARPATELGSRLAAGLDQMLAALDVPKPRVDSELRQMTDVVFARTRNRSVLGSLNDLLFQLTVHLEMHPALSLLEASLKLSRVPLSAIGRDFPDRATQRLFVSEAPAHAPDAP